MIGQEINLHVALSYPGLARTDRFQIPADQRIVTAYQSLFIRLSGRKVPYLLILFPQSGSYAFKIGAYVSLPVFFCPVVPAS